MKEQLALAYAIQREHQRRLEAICAGTARGGISLNPQKEATPDFSLVEEHEYGEMSQYWKVFHEKIPYQDWNQFFSKFYFASSAAIRTLDEEQLLRFICDRKFLFEEFTIFANHENFITPGSFVSGYHAHSKVVRPTDHYNEDDFTLAYTDGKKISASQAYLVKDGISCIYGEKQQDHETSEFERGSEHGTSPGFSMTLSDDGFFDDAFMEQLISKSMNMFAGMKPAEEKSDSAQQSTDTHIVYPVSPTRTIHKSYQEAFSNYHELKTVIAERSKLIEEYPLISDGEKGAGYFEYIVTTILVEDIRRVESPISIECAINGGEQSNRTMNLCIIFCKYIATLRATPYQSVSDYKDCDPLSLYPRLYSIYLKLEEEKLPTHREILVWYHLFTEYTKKVCNGTIKNFQFPQKMRKGLSIQKVAGKQLHKTEVNIQLYDYLLAFFRPKDIARAKFEFFLLSRYDLFTHYVVNEEPVDENIDYHAYATKPFDCKANPNDGVDYLSHLICNHCYNCLYNETEWLVKQAYIMDNPNRFIQHLLLESTQMPSAHRVTDQMRKEMLREDGLELVEWYKLCDAQTKAMLDVLKEFIDKKKWTFQYSFLISEQSKKEDTIRDSETYLIKTLEFYIRETMYKEARQTIFDRAKELLGKYTLNDVEFYE